MSANWGDVPAWAYEAAQALMQSLKIVDPVTYAHCCRVGEMSRKLARDAGLNEYQQKLVEHHAPLKVTEPVKRLADMLHKYQHAFLA